MIKTINILLAGLLVFKPCVSMVVLGFFSGDDTIKSEHALFDTKDDRRNFFQGTEEDLFTYIITHFSPPGSTVLDITSLRGMLLTEIIFYNNNLNLPIQTLGSQAGTVAVATLKSEKNAICILDDEEDVTNVIVKMSSLEHES